MTVARRNVALPPTLQPIGLPRQVAAVYVGVSLTKFDEMVAAGLMPSPKRIGGLVLWFRPDLDLAFANLPNDGDRNPWDG